MADYICKCATTATWHSQNAGLRPAKSIASKCRIGQDAYAEFSVEDPKQLPAFAKQTIKVTFRSPGPRHGPRAARFAREQANVLRAVLSFYTATALEDGVANPVSSAEFPADSAVNGAIPEFTARGVSIWGRMSHSYATGAIELVARLINSLTAYEHALHQFTVEAAAMFYVAAIEALTVPNHRYAHLRVTSRFTKSLIELAGAELERTLGYPNFSQAFESSSTPVRTPSQLANRIYALRSSPVHTGRFGLGRLGSFFSPMPIDGEIRCALLGNVAQAAIIEFATRPFTSLIGHMAFEPSCRIELTEEEYMSVRAAAIAENKGLEDYILESLGLNPRS